MALHLISYGTRIRCGVYRVQARFARAVNFVHGPALVALVTPAVGDGPINIVARTLIGVIDTSILKITRTHFVLDGVAHPKRLLHKYAAVMNIKPSATPVFVENLRHCEDVLRQQAPPHSLPRLVTAPGTSRFVQCLATRLRCGMRQMRRGTFAAGARTLKGLGCGLTPSGDDFLCGFLLGCRVAEKLHGVDLASTRRSILTHALGGNLLSNAFLHCAAEGRPFMCTRNLILALARPDAAAVRACTERLLAVGATSGADTATGLLCALTSAHLPAASNAVWCRLQRRGCGAASRRVCEVGRAGPARRVLRSTCTRRPAAAPACSGRRSRIDRRGRDAARPSRQRPDLKGQLQQQIAIRPHCGCCMLPPFHSFMLPIFHPSNSSLWSLL